MFTKQLLVLVLLCACAVYGQPGGRRGGGSRGAAQRDGEGRGRPDLQNCGGDNPPCPERTECDVEEGQTEGVCKKARGPGGHGGPRPDRLGDGPRPQRACTADSDCGRGSCVDGSCQRPERDGPRPQRACAVDSDCGRGSCVDGSCQRPERGEPRPQRACAVDSDCGRGSCVDGSCQKPERGGPRPQRPCSEAQPCRRGDCVDGFCQRPPRDGGDGGDDGVVVVDL